MPNICCSSQEFLDLGMGDDEEHAILLCNYFNYIDQKLGRQHSDPADIRAAKFNYVSYLVYGEEAPRGTTWYVGRRDTILGYIELWNPTTGTCYNFDLSINSVSAPLGGSEAVPDRNQRIIDPICPLKKIWSFVGDRNVWINVQPETAPVLLNYNLDEKTCW
jgi:coiled-coil and C2 domain-containing protein 2A